MFLSAITRRASRTVDSGPTVKTPDLPRSISRTVEVMIGTPHETAGPSDVLPGFGSRRPPSDDPRDERGRRAPHPSPTRRRVLRRCAPNLSRTFACPSIEAVVIVVMQHRAKDDRAL